MSRDEILALEVIPAGLSPEDLDAFALKFAVASLQQQGVSAAEALARMGSERSPAWATKQRRRLEEFGAAGLLDLRKFNGREEETMLPRVKTIVMGYWHKFPAAGSGVIAKKVKKRCSEEALPIPSNSTVKAFLEGLPDEITMTRGGDFGEWDRQVKPTLRFRPTKYANQRFQADHTRLDIWGRIRVDGVWKVVEVFLTLLLDDFSRAIPGMAITVGTANSWSITQALRHAILPKETPGWPIFGVPEVFQCDRGTDFTSNAVKASLGTLGIQLDLDPAYYPNRKGKVERIFQTLDHACLRGLPGHMDAVGRTEGAAKKRIEELLTVEQIEREIQRWITKEYHHRTHSTTDRTPLDLWQETAHPRMPEEEEVFKALLHMESGVRKIQPTVKFSKNGSGGEYWSPFMAPHYGERVRIAYNPADMRRIVLLSEIKGDLVAEPWLLGHPDCPFDRETILLERKKYRNGLKERIKSYKVEIEDLEAEAKSQEQMDEARQIVENTADSESEPRDPDEEEAEEILRQMEARRHSRSREGN